MKRKIIIKNKKSLIAIVLILSLSIIGVTYAYLMDNDNEENVFTVADPEVKLVETFPENYFTDETKTLTKEVSVVNERTADMVVRVSYNEFFYEPYGYVSTGEYTIPDYEYAYSTTVGVDNLGEVVKKNWTTDWTDLWVENDGWYYYKKILKPNDSIKILDSVTLMGDYSPHPYSGLSYELNFNLESVQATAVAIKDLWNKNVTIEGEDVTWAF